MTAPTARPPVAPARPLVVSALLATLAATATLFAVGFDQGQLTGLLASGVDSMLTHELFHDARHMLGFPCH